MTPIIVNGLLVLNTKKRYRCTYNDCEKAYSKPSRLEEHARSHTGQRPFICITCKKSYLRETHLQAHTRSHLPSSARPFACTEEHCEKRFWTSQHLRVHSDSHKGAKPFACTEPACEEAFAKHHQLRAHACAVHAPSGTKPYRCEHENCTRSFSTNQKLRTHAKVHDDKRYTCVRVPCLAGAAYYPTWTALQQHIRTAHPPTCTHPSCSGRVFSSQKGLRAHLKLHEQRDIEAELVGESEGDEPPRKKRRGGEIGRDWKCEAEGCEKDFKSKKALATHNHVAHLGHRDHVCPDESCKRSFGYKHLLQRHLAKAHRDSDSDSGSSDGESTEQEKGEFRTDIDAITGQAYATRAQERLRSSGALRCPYPHLGSLVAVVDVGVGGSRGCEYVFSRAYDLRRHLKAEHGVETDKESLDEWVKSVKGITTLYTE